MMKFPVLLLVGLALAGCVPPRGQSPAGAGTYEDYLRKREGALQGQAAPVLTEGGSYSPDFGAPAPAASAPSGSIGADTLEALRATSSQASTGHMQFADPVETYPVTGGTNATPGRVVTAGSVPMTQSVQSGMIAAPAVQKGVGPDLRAFARGATNPVGRAIYRRSADAGQNGCTRFNAPDVAQSAFLQNGGPLQDPLNLDADGDGYACGWTPEQYRTAQQ